MVEIVCKKCKTNMFTINKHQNCEDCKYNGWMTQDNTYWKYGQIPNNKVIRQAENEGECKMGNNYNFGCWLIKCTNCGHIIHHPLIEAY